MLTGKTVALGVTGGIAVYKAAEVLRDLTKRGAEVHVIMTANSQRFVSRLVFEALSHRPVIADMWEARSLNADISARSGAIRDLVSQLTDRLPTLRAEHRAALEERLQNFLKDVPVDPQRLAQEVAYLADRSDVSEELTRLASHLHQLEGFLASGEPVGRKLDFVVQELNREVNTIGSKLHDISVAQVVIELKHELEKIREQVQNLE